MRAPTRAFSRLNAFITAVSGLIAAGMSQASAFAQVGDYVSHGKKQGNKTGKYFPHQGEQEKARRRRQMARGII